MTCMKQDKPYKSIDLTLSEMFALKYALRDRQCMLEKDMADYAFYDPPHEVVVETASQLESVRAVLALLETD